MSMLLRSVTFVVVCAPVWLMYASGPAPAAGLRRLPAASAVVWTGVNGTLCFAGAAVRARERGQCHRCRRIRVHRRRRRAATVPTLRFVEPGPVVAGDATAMDLRLWPRVQRAMAVPAGIDAPPAERPEKRDGVVRFFDGRVTICGVGGVVIENPDLVPSPGIPDPDA